jgi:hypothetical protein
MKSVISAHYFPCLAYFTALLQYEEVMIDFFEYYEKQTYRNRCRIVTPHKVQDLSIPILKGNSKQVMRDVKIDYHENWVNVHWRSIASAYGKAPFFEFYADFFRTILYKKPVFLLDLNMEILTTCLKIIGIKKNFEFTEKYLNLGENIEYTDLREAIHPKKQGQIDRFYRSFPYLQMFGNKFEANMSILDLLFCQGNESLQVLKASVPNKSTVYFVK